MKKKLLLIVLLVASLSSGCNKVSEDSSFIKGKEKLESHQYEAALSLFSQVLDDNPENESARAMYMQARKMENAEIYEKNYDYDKAIKELDAIVNINNGSKKIKRESINKKAELEKLQQQAEKEALQRREDAKKASKKDMNKLESQIIYNNEKEETNKEENNKQEDNNQEGNDENKQEESNKIPTEKPIQQQPSDNDEENSETSTQIQLN